MMKVMAVTEWVHAANTLPLVDVRSEGEYQRGHIPGSISIPLLNNEARKEIGTLYKQSGKEAAIMRGFKLVGPEFYTLFRALRKHAANRSLAICCWRGGMRSNIAAWMLNLADYDIRVIDGGYKSYRQYAHHLFAQPYQWRILSGKTGTGKTKLLQVLAARGAQVLDLEALANHKGSAFGHLGLPPQPAVEHFENLIAWQLQKMDPAQPIWIENESRFIGKVKIPDALFNQTLCMPVVEVQLDETKRRAGILAEYSIHGVQQLIAATEKLSRKLGSDRTVAACTALMQHDWDTWLDILLHYYDKTYEHSKQVRKGQVQEITLTGDVEQDAGYLLQHT